MATTKEWLRILVSAIIALLFFQFTKLPEGYWLIFSAMVFVNIQVEDSFLKNQVIIVALGLTMIVMIFICHFLSMYYFLLAGFIFTTVFWGIYLGLKEPVLLYPVLVLNLVGLLAIDLSLAETIRHMEAVAVGFFITLIVRSFVFPPTFKNNFQKSYDTYLISLQSLQTQIFEIYLKRDYSDTKYYYEKKLHQKRFQVFNAINPMRVLIDKMPSQMRQFYIQLLNHINILTEKIFSLGNLRYRIKDFSTLEVCEKELAASSKAIRQAIETLASRKSFAIQDQFMVAFETIYQTTLQVVTNEPWIFLVFIHNIKELLGEFKAIATYTKNNKGTEDEK